MRVFALALVVAGLVAVPLVWLNTPPVFVASGTVVTGLALLAWTWPRATALHASFEIAPAHLAALDAKGTIILVNDPWRQFAMRNGFAGDGHGVGVNYIELCESASGECSEESKETAAGLRRVLAGEQEVFTLEYPCHSPASQRWFRCVIARFPGGQPGALVAHVDITSEVKTRAVVCARSTQLAETGKILTRSRREIADLKAALDEHNIVAVCDMEGRFLYVNERYCAVSGYRPEELLGSNARLADVPERMRELLAGRVWQGEVRKQHRDGSQYWVAETALPFHDDSGNTNQFVLIGTDVTASHQPDPRSESEMARSNAMLTEFAFLAAHDLQEPLRGVHGCVQLIATHFGGQMSDEGREWIRYAVRDTERMQSLISGLLDLSRMERSRSNLAGYVDCDAVVSGAIAALRESIAESRAQVRVSGPLPAIQGDSRQIGQVFQNLISNAVKFRRNEPPRVEITASQTADGFIEFSVCDNGIGIDPKHAGRIFGPFQRLHGQQEYPGCGIGLSIARRIVERHGGRIWVGENQEEGAGAELRFTLPGRHSEPAEVMASSMAKAKGAAA